MAKELLAEARETDHVPGPRLLAVGAGPAAELLRVRDLIELLVSADPDAPVVLRGPYGGYDYVSNLSPLALCLNVNSLAGFGAHDVPADDEAPDALAMVLLSDADKAVFD